MTEMIETSINGRWSLLLPEHRADRAEWATGWERERLDSMFANLKPGDVLYDIGTEEGDMSGLFAMWVSENIVARRGGGVVLVEPNPRVWPNIKAVFEANHLPDPLYTHVGFAGSTPEDWNTDWSEEHAGDGIWPSCADGPLIGDHGFLNLSERPEVPVITIDTIAMSVGRCDAITVDVEGAELRVMLGAHQTLTHFRPLVWISVHPEFGFNMYRTYASELHGFMHSCGYVKRWLAFDHEEHWVYVPTEKRDEFVLTDRADWS